MIYSFCVFIFRFQIFFWLLLFHFSFSFSVFRCFFHFQFLFCVFYFACFIFVFHVSFSFILFSSDNNKIGSLTVEVFLIWTNVTRTNVARINVTLTVGVCSRCYQEPKFKVHQNWINNSWDIADIEFLWGGGGGVQSHFRV